MDSEKRIDKNKGVFAMKNNIVNIISALKLARLVRVTPLQATLQPVVISISSSLSRQYADRVRGAPNHRYRH